MIKWHFFNLTLPLDERLGKRLLRTSWLQPSTVPDPPCIYPPWAFVSQQQYSTQCLSSGCRCTSHVVYLWTFFHGLVPIGRVDKQLVGSGCLTQWPASLMCRCLMVSDSLGRQPYRSTFLMWSSQETLRAAFLCIFHLGSLHPWQLVTRPHIHTAGRFWLLW